MSMYRVLLLTGAGIARGRRWKRPLTLLTIVTMVLASERTVRVQITFMQREVNTPAPTDIFFTIPYGTCSDGTQTLPAGGYVKGGGGASTQVNVGGAVLETGFCDWFLGPPPPAITEVRRLNFLFYYQHPPGLLESSINPTAAAWGKQAIDTSAPWGTDLYGSGPQGAYINIEGEWTFRAFGQSFGTQCNIPTDSPSISRSLYALACLPTWRFENGLLTRFPTDGDIKLSYPSSVVGLEAAVETSVTAWNTQLTAAGLINVHFVGAPDEGCATLDAKCVQITVQTCPIDPLACGCRVPPAVDGSGVYTTRTVVYLNNAFSNWSSEARAWTVAHEIGHALSLGNASQPTCGDSTTVMHGPPTCGTVDSFATAPTSSDATPVSKTVYGPGPTIVCQ